MTFIDDNAVEKLRRVFVVIYNRFGLLVVRSALFKGGRFLKGFVHFFPLENGIHALNCADADLDVLRNVRTVKTLYAVNLGERAAVVVGLIGEKFLLRLLAQGFCIDQKENPLHLAEFQKPIRRRDCRKRFACAGRHLHQRFRTVVRKRFIEILNRRYLAFSESGRVEFREPLHVVANRVVLSQQRAERFRSVKRKDLPGSIFDVFVVCKTRQLTGGFVRKADFVIGVNMP